MPEHSGYKIDFLASVETWNLILHIHVVVWQLTAVKTFKTGFPLTVSLAQVSTYFYVFLKLSADKLLVFN